LSGSLRILVLSAGYGEGHIQVSRVLQRCFHSRGIENVKIVDLIGEAHPVINTITRYMYLKSYYIAPFVYGWLYYGSRQMGPDTLFSRLMKSFGLKKLEEIIVTEKPHAVINTFPHPAMSAFLKKTGVNIPTFTVITDFTLHYRWIQPEIDKYYVASDDLKNEMVAAGIPPERIKVSGIPLRETFNRLPDITGLHQKYGLNPAKKTILVMSGAYGGLHKINEICRSILKIPDSEIAVVCGKDKTMEKLLKNTFHGCRSIHIYGFVEDIHELMKIACCIIMKAGGITLSEAVAAQLLIIIFRPVPGQERDNALYFAGKKAAVVVNQAGELYRQISDLLSNGEKMSRMRASVRSLQRPRAAETVVDDILNVLNELERQRKPTKGE
jgi:processive 1,2-diacylglycerol beta-glucosyltransferase